MLTKTQTTVQRFDFDGFPIDAQEDVCRQYNGGAAARNEKIFNEADDGAMGGALADALGKPAPPKNTAKTYRKVMGGDYREAGKDYQEANTRAKELKNKKNASTPITTAAKDEVVKSKTVTVKSGTTSRKSKTSKKTTTPAKKSGGKGKGKKVEYAPNAASRVNRPRSEAPEIPFEYAPRGATFTDVGWNKASPELKAAVRAENKARKKKIRSGLGGRNRGLSKLPKGNIQERIDAASAVVDRLAKKEHVNTGLNYSVPRNYKTKGNTLRTERVM